MTGWYEEPGRLAHLVTSRSSLEERGLIRGWSLRTSCDRTLVVFYDGRAGSAHAATWPLRPMRDDGSRRVCLRCWYWSLVHALVILPRADGSGYDPGFREFAAAVGVQGAWISWVGIRGPRT